MDTNYLIVLGIILFLKFRGESNVLYLGVALVSIYFIMNNETEGFDYLDLPRCSPSASPSYDKDKNLTIPLVKYDTTGKKSCISVTIPHWKGECGGSEKGLCEEGSTCDSNYKCSPCPPGFFGPMCESPPPPSPFPRERVGLWTGEGNAKASFSEMFRGVHISKAFFLVPLPPRAVNVTETQRVV